MNIVCILPGDESQENALPMDTHPLVQELNEDIATGLAGTTQGLGDSETDSESDGSHEDIKLEDSGYVTICRRRHP